MQRYIIGPPPVEPLVLTEVKRWLRVDHIDDDPLISSLIKMARERVEARTGRALLAQSWRIVLDRWPPGNRIKLPIMPVLSIAAIRVANAAGIFSVLAPAVYTLEAKLDPPEVALSQHVEPGLARSGIELDVIAGYGIAPADCPESLRQAMLLIIADAYARRGPDQTVQEQRPATAEIENLLLPYRSLRLGRAAMESAA